MKKCKNCDEPLDTVICYKEEVKANARKLNDKARKEFPELYGDE